MTLKCMVHRNLLAARPIKSDEPAGGGNNMSPLPPAWALSYLARYWTHSTTLEMSLPEGFVVDSFFSTLSTTVL